MPRSAIIWTRSRELSLKARYHLTHRMMISWSKVKVSSLEQILCRGWFCHPGSYRRIPSLSTVCTRTWPTTLTLNPPRNSRTQLLGNMDAAKAQKRGKRLRDPAKEPF
jgi:hypothetical protein